MIWVIEKLWTDSFENQSSAASGYSPEGYCSSEEEADALIKEAGEYKGDCWSLRILKKTYMIRRKVPLNLLTKDN
jgi:hypothetical protein